MLKKRNYKVYADIGVDTRLLSRRVAILDTGAGPNFIHRDALPPDVEVLKQGQLPSIADANNRPLSMSGRVDLFVQLGYTRVRAEFLVCERLAAPMIIGADFCDQHVEAILPRRRTVELTDGTTIPIVRKVPRRHPKAPKLPPEQEYVPASGRISPKVRVSSKIVLAPESQTFVSVTCKGHGAYVVEPSEDLYTKHGLTAANGIVFIKPDIPFRILIANFKKTPFTLAKGQVVARLLEHPTQVFPSKVTVGEVLGIVEDDVTQDGLHNPKEVGEVTPRVGGEKKASQEDEPLVITPGKTCGGSWEKPPSADDVDLSHLPEKMQEKVRKLLRKYSKMYDGTLGEIRVTEHKIDLKEGSEPYAQNPYRAGPKAREFEAQEIDRMLKAGVIEPAQSEWASPVVLVPKKDGTLRFCVDYRRLNAMSVRDSYPLPRMDECIDSLGEAKVFTTLDCNWGYWQVPIREKDRDKTTFASHSGLYRFLRMPFELMNAPATFQRALDIVLSPFKWRTCLIYLDDVIIYSKNFEDHFRHVESILDALFKANVTLKIKKCVLFADTVNYLGHVIKPGQLAIDRTHTTALREAKHPRTQTELRSFLGLCNVYRRFVHDYTKIASPLNELLKKGTSVTLPEFNDEQAQAFRTLIDAVTNPPVLALPQPDLPYTVDTDASDYQVGATLFQTHQDGERKPIGYWSRTLKPAEKNYSTPEKECLAVVWALTTLRPYLQGVQFTVYSDQASLRWLMTIAEPSGRLMRWRLRLSEFDFVVLYKKGKINTQADALSRLPTSGDTTSEIDDEIPCFKLEEEEEEDPVAVAAPFCSYDGRYHIDDDEHDFMDESPEWDEIVASQRNTDEPVNVITPEELLRAQANDSFCLSIRSSLNGGRTCRLSMIIAAI